MHYMLRTILEYINQDDKLTERKGFIFSIKRNTGHSRHDILWNYVNMIHYLKSSIY
jgi:hypothetical protein